MLYTRRCNRLLPQRVLLRHEPEQEQDQDYVLRFVAEVATRGVYRSAHEHVGAPIAPARIIGPGRRRYRQRHFCARARSRRSSPCVIITFIMFNAIRSSRANFVTRAPHRFSAVGRTVTV